MDTKISHLRSLRGAIAAVVFGVTACTGSPMYRAAPPKPPPAAPAVRLTDAEIARAVENALGRSAGIDAKSIRVATTEGVVELTGTVRDLLSKRRAARLVEGVKGVRAVSDQIVLTLPARADEELSRDIKSVLAIKAAPDASDIEVTADNGAVTLGGRVKTYQERVLAERLAEGVRGVREVKNAIDVDNEVKLTDVELAANVRHRLQWDALVNDGLLTVEVENGRVVLGGYVASASERRRAALDAWVVGVKSVDDSGIQVAWWARTEDFMRHKRAAKSATEIQDAVQDAMAYDPRVSAVDVYVDVLGQLVTLRGSVGTPQARSVAEELARNTVGVREVQNDLKVVPKTSVADPVIEQYVRTVLMYDPYLYASDISVHADRGAVTLTGSVETAFERAQATDLASTVIGVKNVDNNLSIRKPETAYIYDPRLDPYEPFVTSRRYTPERASRGDADVTQSIREELAWSPNVDADHIQVSVDKGTATLKGIVGSFAERREATDEAYEGGALVVKNQLEIRLERK